MKKLKHKICSIVVLGIVTLISAPFSCAGTIEQELCCAPGFNIPKTFTMPAKSNTQYSVTTKGIRLKIHGVDNEIFPKVLYDYKNDYSKEAIMAKQKLIRKAQLIYPPVVEAQCSSMSQPISMWPGGTNLSCNKGDKLTVSLYAPVCKYDDTDQDNKECTVFDVTVIEDTNDIINNTTVPTPLEIDLNTNSLESNVLYIDNFK